MTPILTTLNINIGDLFIYQNMIWTRIDTYTAKCQKSGCCRFGYLGESNGMYDDEWKTVLDTSHKLDQHLVEQILLDNLLILLDD